MKKIILLLILLTSTTLMSAQTTGKVNGVITYFFNKYKGDVPDIGSKVLLIDSTKASGKFNNIPYEFRYSAVDSFYNAKIYYNLYQTYVAMKMEPSASIMEYYNKYNLQDEEHFKAITKNASQSIIIADMFSDENIGFDKTTVDGSGNFSIDLPPGVYYVIIQSNNRENVNLVEASGKIYPKKIKVYSNKVTNITHNFGVNE